MRLKTMNGIAVLGALVTLGAVSAGPALAASKPVVETLSATNYFATSVTLTGTVNPEGLETSYRFEYGTGLSYGKESTDEILPPGTSPVEASKAISGLVTGTTYHYRLVAKNSDGTTDGSDKTFVAEPVKYEWKVNGAALASGSSKEFTLKSKSGETFHMYLPSDGPEERLTSSNVKLAIEDKGTIAGGKPGTFEARLEFENVAVEKPKTGCRIKEGRIRTYELTGELVEQAEAKKGTGVVEILLRPSEGGEWATIDFEKEKTGSACWPVEAWKQAGKIGQYPILRNTMLEVLPAKEEATVRNLQFVSPRVGTEYEYVNSKGVLEKAEGLINTVSEKQEFVGEPEMELVSKEVFGAF